MTKKSNSFLKVRPRRLRRTAAHRKLAQENDLLPRNFVLPLFVMEGSNKETPIKSMPGVSRLSIDHILKVGEKALKLGIPAVALFPYLPESAKDSFAKESVNKNGLLQKTVRSLKKELPELVVITDVAMDPYSTDGHDGLVQNGIIVNDESVEILKAMALAQAEAGADFVAPSDMMDGRVGAIRRALDDAGFTDVGIISYSAKYASSFYGPFRDALDSAPRFGDKKTYQMNPLNSREAVKEILLDLREGADMVMVKPALSYLDIIAKVRAVSNSPVAAYNVSGEYSMVKLGAKAGLFDEKKITLEILGSMKRAGADVIFTYHALEAAEWLK